MTEIYQCEKVTPVFLFLYSCAVSNLKKCSLELGGKSPLIIFHDCDMDRAVRQVRTCYCMLIRPPQGDGVKSHIKKIGDVP